MSSVIVCAHNEETVLGACLDALLKDRDSTGVEIIVSANGCTDRTAQVAGAFEGVLVIDRAAAGKAGALNAGDAAARSFPRAYLDADIVVPPGGLEQLARALDRSPGTLAVVPRRRIDTRDRPLLVKAYFAINERLPAFRGALFGRGLMVLSQEGRRRFDEFPDLIADDVFVDSLFSVTEKSEISTVEVIVGAPYRTKDLLNRLVRVRRGTAQLRAAAAAGDVNAPVRPSDRWAWLRDVVVPEPRLVIAAIPYVLITAAADLLGRRPNRVGWGHDRSTRTMGARAPHD